MIKINEKIAQCSFRERNITPYLYHPLLLLHTRYLACEVFEHGGVFGEYMSVELV
jgi:hypothetical protein